MSSFPTIDVRGAREHNLKSIDVTIERGSLTVVTGVSGSGKSSLAFDTILSEARRRFFYTLSHYSRQFLDMGARPKVATITGLSPAIALAQNETPPSIRASVATLTDVGELMSVLFARFGEKKCPTHGVSTESSELAEIVSMIAQRFSGQLVGVCAPVVEKKKGVFRAQLKSYGDKGFQHVWIDGKTVELSPIPELEKEQKHTIKVIIDRVKVSASSLSRIERSLQSLLSHFEGPLEIIPLVDHELQLSGLVRYSLEAGCPACGFSWPKLDSRYFSANSLGRCVSCDGLGSAAFDQDEFEPEDLSALDIADQGCSACHGTGLSSDLAAITISGRSILDLQNAPISEVRSFVEQLGLSLGKGNAAAQRVIEELLRQLQRIDEVRLGYLQLKRRIRSLSGGESQRLKLSGILGEHLRGVLYVLDEPSQGLHPSEIQQLVESLQLLKSKGNTLLVVDHDETLMRHADWILDLGPGGGAEGGHVMAKFRPRDASAFVKQSRTAAALARSKVSAHGALSPAKKKAVGPALRLDGCSLHNLRVDSVSFPLAKMSVVTGVSGAGKSSLVVATLLENLLTAMQSGTFKPRYCTSIKGFEAIESVTMVNRKPIAKSSVSMPASYLDVFTEIRKLYEMLPEAQIAGLDASSFSLHKDGGRCPECRGRGEITLSMRFLPDARVQCHVCHGARYRPPVLNVRYGGLSISEVLELTISEACEHFKNMRIIKRRLDPALKLGLGYLKMGQPSSSLSGGEAQRLKLVPLLSKQHGRGSIIVMDEPTTGLHFEDVEKLQTCLHDLCDRETTIVLIEHNLDLILASDWVVDLGPGAAVHGGQLMYQGPVEGLIGLKGSETGRVLAEAVRG